MDNSAIDSRLSGRGGIHQQTSAARNISPSTSVLACRLKELWSWGSLSAPMLQWLAAGVAHDLKLFRMYEFCSVLNFIMCF